MKKFILFAVMAMLVAGTTTISTQAAEEKIEAKQNKDGSWKMKIKRKGDKDWEGFYNGKTYHLRGDAFTNFRDEGDYTVYGSISNNDYVDVTRVERYEVREPIVESRITTVPETEYRMKVIRRDNDWVGTHEGKTYVLRGDSVREIHNEGEYTFRGSIGKDGSFSAGAVIRK